MMSRRRMYMKKVISFANFFYLFKIFFLNMMKWGCFSYLINSKQNEIQSFLLFLWTEIIESRRYVSAREYLCFRLQIREAEFNIMFHGWMLFQQWAVDMYVKVESICLDWYSKPAHQDLIRADLYQVRSISG